MAQPRDAGLDLGECGHGEAIGSPIVERKSQICSCSSATYSCRSCFTARRSPFSTWLQLLHAEAHLEDRAPVDAQHGVDVLQLLARGHLAALGDLGRRARLRDVLELNGGGGGLGGLCHVPSCPLARELLRLAGV